MLLVFKCSVCLFPASRSALLIVTFTTAVKPWRGVLGKALLFLLNLYSAVALIFEGYNHGVLETVSETP